MPATWRPLSLLLHRRQWRVGNFDATAARDDSTPGGARELEGKRRERLRLTLWVHGWIGRWSRGSPESAVLARRVRRAEVGVRCNEPRKTEAVRAKYTVQWDPLVGETPVVQLAQACGWTLGPQCQRPHARGIEPLARGRKKRKWAEEKHLGPDADWGCFLFLF
jgi:hypothetical protein